VLPEPLAGDTEPQAGEQATPLCVKVQVTPLAAGSFVIVAVKVCVPLTATDGLLGASATLIGGAAVIVIVAEANFVVSATEVAVSVTIGVAGTAAGAV
jgi:hypothetical protein